MLPAVIGGSGFVGLHVLDALRARGAEPLAIVRSPLPRAALRSRGVRVSRADVNDPDALEDALMGHTSVVHAAAFYPRTSLDPVGAVFAARAQMRCVLEACANAHVRRLVFVSSTATVASAVDRASDERDVYAGSPGFGAYHDAKWAMEDLALRESRFEVVVVCPGACLGPLDLRLGTNGVVVAAARGLVPAFADGWVNTVDVRDVAKAIAALVEARDPPKRLVLVGENHRLSRLLAHVAARHGADAPPAPVAAEVARRLADAIERRDERPTLPREFVDLVLHGCEIDAGLATRTLGLRWTPLDETLDAFDAWARRYALIPRPRSGETHAARPL